MNQQQEIQLFQSLAGNQPRLKDWLQIERDKQVKILCTSTDLHIIQRAQGQVAQVDRMLMLLEKAPTLRA